jgi:hypothetical protein
MNISFCTVVLSLIQGIAHNTDVPPCSQGWGATWYIPNNHLSTHYIFIASCTMRFSWSVSCFSFQFFLVLFDAINGWNPTNSFWRSCLAFHLPRTLCFSFLSFNECSLFLELRLAFDFRLDLCSDLVISLHQGVF